MTLQDWKRAYQADLDQLINVIDWRASDQYLCTFSDQHQEWMSLHEDCDEVEVYWDCVKKNENNDDIVMMDNYGECAKSPNLFEGKGKGNQDSNE